MVLMLSTCAQLTNTLQKKLNEVRREKALLEKQIELEHSSNLELRKAKFDSVSESTSTLSSIADDCRKEVHNMQQD